MLHSRELRCIVYDLCNKLLSETTGSEVTKYSYDTLGNLTEKVSSEGTTTYTYDVLNHLTEVVNPDGTWQRNTYDASGIRSMIAENGVTTEFMTFNGLVLSGYNKDGEQTEHYYYGNSLLAVEYANADLFYYLKNSHGDVIGFTDNTGTLTETYRYDAFGMLTNIQSLNEDGVLVKAETALSCFLYAGEQYDAVTGLYYLRARQYDTAIGRFTQEDTYLGDGRNLYAYVSNNSLKYVDPSGREKSGGYDPVNLYNKNYLFLKPKPKEILAIQKQQEEAEKEARKKLVIDGTYNVFKGFMEATSGAMVTISSVVVMPAHPVLGYSGATVGTSYANMGLSNMSEGAQDIFNGITGNVEVPAFNPTRDVFFGGNQEAYNYAEAFLGITNDLLGMGLSFIPPKGPSAGNISGYANAGKQTSDALDVVESGTVPDFYVGPNGKVLPNQYKDWIGTNIQRELLDQAENPQLQNAIKQLFRGNSFIGDGGTADVLRFEQQTGLLLGKNGGSHVQKGIDMAKYIENKILTQDLSPSDRALATQLLEDLYSALGR